MKVPIKLTVNGMEYSLDVAPNRTLMDVLRERCQSFHFRCETEFSSVSMTIVKRGDTKRIPLQYQFRSVDFSFREPLPASGVPGSEVVLK